MVNRNRGFTYDAEVLLRQSSTVQLNEFERKYRGVRLKVYNFLDHPLSSRSTSYHFGVFLFVLLAVILGATTETIENHWMIDVYSIMEKILGVFFLVEFVVRMWAISADAKYMGWRGHFRYLCRFVCLCDITMITVTLAMLILDKNYISNHTMAYLRFAQILRLFHIDRQMTTWRLIKDMVMISRMELFSAYYITFIIVLLLTNLVYYTEHFHNPSVATGTNNRTREGASETFPTLAHAWWYSVVSILTIGYGDIVPQFWGSKMIVCILGFVAYCTFVTASTQISVGLTLMMEEDNKKEYKNKLRNTAAGVIQCWWRYHLATLLSKDLQKKTKYFKLVCYKLYLTEERLKKIRQYEKRSKERKEKKKRFLVSRSSFDRGFSSFYSNGPPIAPTTNTSNPVENQWKYTLRYGVTSQVIHPTGIQHASLHRSAAPFQRFMSLNGDSQHGHTYSGSGSQGEHQRRFHRRHSTDTTVSSSFDCSDSEQMREEELLREATRSIDINAVDERLLTKYQPLLRFFNFLLFRELTKKFQRLRKADKLLEIEAEISEQDHERVQLLRELEQRVNGMVGRTVVSPLDPSGERLNINQRVELCESKMQEMESKVDMINKIADSLYQSLTDAQQFPCGLPPLPPGKRINRRLRRQVTISPTREEIDNEHEEAEPEAVNEPIRGWQDSQLPVTDVQQTTVTRIDEL